MPKPKKPREQELVEETPPDTEEPPEQTDDGEIAMTKQDHIEKLPAKSGLSS